MNYFDFDVLVEKSATGYKAKVINSPAGQASHTFTLPFSALELENFVLRLGHLRRGTRRVESPAMEAAKEFGSKLFNALFADDIKSCWQNSLHDATRNHMGLRLRLRLSDTPELLDVPWEFLYYGSLNRFLSLSKETPLIRYLDLPVRTPTLTVSLPLRVLVMISSPHDYPTLDVEYEWQRLKQAVARLERTGLLLLDRLPMATLGALQRQLRQYDYHIFHFIGHGAYDRQAQDGVLLLENEQGASRLISGQYLGMILHDEASLRLALLNCCEGGRTSATDPFAGVCQSLVQQGIPAVIAMQFAISDQAAITLTHEFYTALADGLPVDTALAEARKSLFAENNDIEWGTPVLYMRTATGQIFDIANRPTSTLEPAGSNYTIRRLLPKEWPQWRIVLVGLGLLLLFTTLWFLLASKQIGDPQRSDVVTTLTPHPVALPATFAGPSPANTEVSTRESFTSTGTVTAQPQDQSTLIPTPVVTTDQLLLQSTRNPTVIGNVYTFDDSDGDGWDVGGDWTVVSLESGGGALQVLAPQEEWSPIDLREKYIFTPDMALQVRVRILQPTNRTRGDSDLKLSIRSNLEHPSGFESYSVFVSSYLQSISLRREAVSSYLDRIELGQAGFAWQLNHWYILRVEARGNRISVSVDDKEWIAVEDSVLANGYFYLTAAPGTNIQFDEIQVLP
jgi:hypothetical protein